MYTKFEPSIDIPLKLCCSALSTCVQYPLSYPELSYLCSLRQVVNIFSTSASVTANDPQTKSPSHHPEGIGLTDLFLSSTSGLRPHPFLAWCQPLSTTAFPRTPLLALCKIRFLEGGRGGLEHTRRGVPPSSPEDAQGPAAVGVPWERAASTRGSLLFGPPGPFVRYQLMTAHMARRRYRRRPLPPIYQM
ncbi:hypothetical protein CEXT_34141 [Caerostris extrusa]|uniref:Uncharacterized protein n=1 Tax=Caerostris extrusa TaxID=172846 RepID=A0AAV4PK89_CAEEX|nr:hypothetical protein CEXT_34141 [Caerostris extrusa]